MVRWLAQEQLVRDCGSHDSWISAILNAVKSLSKPEQWMRYLASSVVQPTAMMTVRVHNDWIVDTPDELPAELSRFARLEFRGRDFPVFVLTKGDLDAFTAAIGQRRAVQGAHAIYENLIEECARKESFALITAKELEQTINQIDEQLVHQTTFDDPGLQYNEEQRGKVEHLRGEFKRVEWLREDLLLERAAMMSALLVHHSNTWLAYMRADRDLEAQLERTGRLNNGKEEFFSTWRMLPPSYLKGRLLHKAWTYFQQNSSRGSIAEGENAWTAFVNDQNSFYSAVNQYEIARVDLRAAKRCYEKWDEQQTMRDADYQRVRAARREVPSLSQHARECFRVKTGFLHQYTKAEQNFRLATQRLAKWNELKEHDMNPYAFVPISPSENSEDKRFNAAIRPEVRVSQIHVAKDKAEEIADWEAAVPPPQSDSGGSTKNSSNSKSQLEISSLGESDPASVLETRQYNAVRAQQWGNMRYDEDAHFGVAKARVPASSAPLTGTKRPSEEREGDEWSDLSESSKRFKDVHGETDGATESYLKCDWEKDIDDPLSSEGRQDGVDDLSGNA